MDYIARQCPQADYVFKGDDDILLVPDNILTMIGQMESQNMSSIGCVKGPGEEPVRDLKNKYFVPEEIYNGKTYSVYFSGAAYLTTGSLANQMAEQIRTIPIIPLDDCFIGSIMKHLQKEKYL